MMILRQRRTAESSRGGGRAKPDDTRNCGRKDRPQASGLPRFYRRLENRTLLNPCGLAGLLIAEPCIKNAVAGGWQPGEERTGKSVELEGSKTERRDDVMVKFEKSERKTRKNLRLEILSGLCFLWLELNSNSRFAIRKSVGVGGRGTEARRCARGKPGAGLLECCGLLPSWRSVFISPR
jgi:hypothetical protein